MRPLQLVAILIVLHISFSASTVLARDKNGDQLKPNVVLILADDLGIGDVSAYNANHIPTPHIDSLGTHGIRFTDAHVSAAVCMPSRAGLITGRQGTRHGSEFNAGPGLNLNEQNIGELLKQSGYATAMIGKWHLGDKGGRDPLSRGFDEYFGAPSGSRYVDPRNPDAVNGFGINLTDDLKSDQPTKITVTRGNEQVVENEHLTDAFAREGVNFIGRHKHDPFFLYVAFTAPHAPLQTTKEYYDRFPKITDHKARIYAGMVSALDDAVGSILKKLEADGLDRNTLVIFLSDNGGPDYFRGGPSNAQFSGWKRYHLEGGHRIPFFIRWPAVITGGKVDSRLTSSLDLFPTIAAAARSTISSKQSLDGVTLIPYLNGERSDSPHQDLYWRAGANFAVRDGRWKLVVVNKANVESSRETPRTDTGGLLPGGPYQGVSPFGQLEALYDLDSDVEEKNNLAKTHPEVVARLLKQYDAWNQSNVAANAKSTRGINTVIDGAAVQLAF